MIQLMELLKERQGKMSNEEYANKLGLRGSTLWRYYNGQSEVGIDTLQKLASEFAKKEDAIMLGALVAYALALPDDRPKLQKIGTVLINTGSIPSA